MEMAAHRPQEILRPHEAVEFLAREQARCDELVRLLDPMQEAGDPEQRLQVAQAALAVLDVGLDQIARLAGAQVSRIAFCELGGDEGLRLLGDDLLAKALAQPGIERLFAADVARLQDGGHDGVVAARKADTVIDATGRMPDL